MIKYGINQITGNTLLTYGILILLSLSINLAYNLSIGEFGPIPANFTSKFFHNAYVFHTNGFVGLIEEPFPAYYWLYPVFLSIVRYSLGLQSSFVIIVQIILTAISTILIYKIAAINFNRSTALVAAILFAMTWQIFRWSHFILHDAVEIFFFILVIYVILLLESENNYRLLPPIIILLNLLLFLTPISIIFIIISTIMVTSVLVKRKQYIAILFTVTLIILPLLIIHSFPHSLINFNYLQKGIVIPGIPKYDVEMVTILSNETISSIVFYVTVIAKRMIYFWSIYLGHHSIMHCLFNLVWLLPLYGFGIFGIIKIIKQKKYKFFIILTLSLIIGYTLFHSLNVIDYDQRYRPQLLAILTIYASFGLNYFYLNYFIPLVGRVKKPVNV